MRTGLPYNMWERCVVASGLTMAQAGMNQLLAIPREICKRIAPYANDPSDFSPHELTRLGKATQNAYKTKQMRHPQWFINQASQGANDAGTLKVMLLEYAANVPIGEKLDSSTRAMNSRLSGMLRRAPLALRGGLQGGRLGPLARFANRRPTISGKSK